ncbi:hypothetical protein BMR04_15070 [Methylococcaceae bacterium HT3]|nr:hypothetical protein BMR04_15070 [Methylococcaceae bacterium HT3]
MATHGLESFYNNSNRQYAHFVDGGITDNLGLRAIYEFIELTGGAIRYSKRYKREMLQRIIIISVNASTNPEPQIDKTNKQPSLKDTINSITDIQLHRYNAATLSLMEKFISRWSKELSTPEKAVKPHFIRIAFREAPTASSRKILNTIPTSFSLTDEQVDHLIEAGRSLLRNSPEFQQLINDMQ